MAILFCYPLDLSGIIVYTINTITKGKPIEQKKEDKGMTEQRRDLGFGEKHDLPSRFWEPQPDEEDLKRLEQEYEGSEGDDEPLPFE